MDAGDRFLEVGETVLGGSAGGLIVWLVQQDASTHLVAATAIILIALISVMKPARDRFDSLLSAVSDRFGQTSEAADEMIRPEVDEWTTGSWGPNN